MAKFNEEDIGKRVLYVGRNGNTRYGVLQSTANSVNMVDLKLDNSGTREHFFVPEDAVELLPEQLNGVI